MKTGRKNHSSHEQQVYRERNGIEQLFDDLKNALDCQRLRVHSSSAMQGRLFLQFIALTLLTSIRKVIEEKEPASVHMRKVTVMYSGKQRLFLW
ncbi:MAG: transposase [Sphaerochaetaceae bacterium]|nr:transposase [Sphaerochaetaceae bacterium]